MFINSAELAKQSQRRRTNGAEPPVSSSVDYCWHRCALRWRLKEHRVISGVLRSAIASNLMTILKRSPQKWNVFWTVAAPRGPGATAPYSTLLARATFIFAADSVRPYWTVRNSQSFKVQDAEKIWQKCNLQPSLSSNSSHALPTFPPSLPLGSNTKENLGKQLKETWRTRGQEPRLLYFYT